MPRRSLPHRTYFTDAEFLDLCERYDWRCLCCGQRGQPLEPHRVIPRDRGGLSNIYNMQPLCPDCGQRDTGIDYRTKWQQTSGEKPAEPLHHDDFSYGLIADPQQRLVLYQRTGSIKRLLEEIGRSWDVVNEKMDEIKALELRDEVFEAWNTHEVLPALFRLKERSEG